MAANDNDGPIPLDAITTTDGWFDYATKIRSSRNIFGQQSTFKAKVLTEPTPLTNNTDCTIGDGGKKMCMVRIEKEEMAHQNYITDPCSQALANNPAVVAQLMALHTRMSIPKGRGIEEPQLNDIVEIMLTPGANGAPYDLQIGKFLKITDRPTAIQNPLPSECADLSAQFSNNSAVTHLGSSIAGAATVGMAAGDPGNCDWSNGVRQLNSIYLPTGVLIYNGQLEATGLLWTDPLRGASLIRDAQSDWEALAEAFEKTFPGQTLFASGYRTYEGQVNQRMKRYQAGGVFNCGAGSYYSDGSPGQGVAATPGRSPHGWGSAVDIDRNASKWEHGTTRNPTLAKSSKHFKWVNKNSTQFNFVLSVTDEYWHLDWTGFPTVVQNGASYIKSTRWVPLDSSYDDVPLYPDTYAVPVLAAATTTTP